MNIFSKPMKSEFFYKKKTKPNRTPDLGLFSRWGIGRYDLFHTTDDKLFFNPTVTAESNQAPYTFRSHKPHIEDTFQTD